MLNRAEAALIGRAWRQGGVITAAQTHDAGLSADAVHRRVLAGQWERVYPSTYRVLVVPAGKSTPLWSAALSIPGAIVSGPTAAWWWGLVSDCPQIQVDIPTSTRLTRPGVRLVRRDVPRRDRRVHRGLAVVSLPLAVLQSLGSTGVEAPALLDESLRSATTLAELGATIARHRGEHGMPAAARWLHRAADGARSEAERHAIRWLREADITGWRANHRAGRAVIDLAWPEQRLAVEIDGAAWHATRARFERDRARQNQLVLANWTVLRFTWEQLLGEPHRFVAEIRRALGAA
jgi:very-short-patch-repair endonuclease